MRLPVIIPGDDLDNIDLITDLNQSIPAFRPQPKVTVVNELKKQLRVRTGLSSDGGQLTFLLKVCGL